MSLAASSSRGHQGPNRLPLVAVFFGHYLNGFDITRIPPSEPVRAACHGIRLSTSPEYLLLSYRDSISTSHFPLRCSSGSASTLPPRQIRFQGRYRLLSLCRYHMRL